MALAVERRVSVQVEPADTLEVEGSWGSERLRWTRSRPEGSTLITAIVDTWQEHCRATGPRDSDGDAPEAVKAHILLDSSAFFSGTRKSGFGSSAAVTVALSCALLSLSGFEGVALNKAVADISIAAHRRAQGGRGSGYDVYASLYGGFGCLTGGAKPQWRSVRLPWLPPLYLFRGPSSVSTPGSLGFYERWKAAGPAAFRRFLEQSNRNVNEFVKAPTWPHARPAFEQAKRLGLQLGETIGVPAAIDAPGCLDPGLYKALGAGNELGIYVAEKQTTEPEMELVEVAAEGVRWNT